MSETPTLASRIKAAMEEAACVLETQAAALLAMSAEVDRLRGLLADRKKLEAVSHPLFDKYVSSEERLALSREKAQEMAGKLDAYVLGISTQQITDVQRAETALIRCVEDGTAPNPAPNGLTYGVLEERIAALVATVRADERRETMARGEG